MSCVPPQKRPSLTICQERRARGFLYSLYSFFLYRARILFERACASPPFQLSPRQWIFPHHLCGFLLLLRCLQKGGSGVNGNLLNYPETVTPYHYNWAPLGGGGAYELRPPTKGD